MDAIMGMIVMFGFSWAPRGWMTCQGQILSISQFSALFALIGTTYGGNGSTTFALPDLRGRVPLGQGQGPGRPSYGIGETGGSETNTLTTNQIPAHTHGATATSTSTSTSTLFAERPQQTAQNPVGNMLAAAPIYTPPQEQENRAMSDQAVVTTTTTTTNVTIAPAGGGQPVNNLQPFMAMNYCIAIEGIFPSRN